MQIDHDGAAFSPREENRANRFEPACMRLRIGRARIALKEPSNVARTLDGNLHHVNIHTETINDVARASTLS